MCLVSILIPTHRRAGLLADAIRSAASQTHANIEVLVLDDASNDDGRTAAAVRPFLADPRVQYVCHPKNIGIAANWRTGIGLARGDFFCLLHDDDTFEPTFVAELLAVIADRPEAVIAFCDHWVTDPLGRKLADVTGRTCRMFGRDRLPAGTLADFARAALIDTGVPIGATLFRRRDVTPDLIDDRARGSIDMWLLYGCVKTGKHAVYVPRRLMNYRSHGGGMSYTRPIYMTEGHLWRYERMLADAELTSIHAEVRVMRARTMADYGVHLLAAGRRTEARVVFRGTKGHKALIGRLLAAAGPLGTGVLRLSRRFKGMNSVQG